DISAHLPGLVPGHADLESGPGGELGVRTWGVRSRPCETKPSPGRRSFATSGKARGNGTEFGPAQPTPGAARRLTSSQRAPTSASVVPRLPTAAWTAVRPPILAVVTNASPLAATASTRASLRASSCSAPTPGGA